MIKETLVFTLCSNNYLAHAKSLGDSLVQQHPGLQFFIGLVDKKDPAIDYSFFDPFRIIPFDEIGCEDFPDMLSRYNVIEFNTAVKPFYIEYFFNNFPDVKRVYYIDPDIYFFKPLDELEELLNRHSIVLTPHLTIPTAHVSTDELIAMRHGHFNLGFIGLQRCHEAMEFTKWWQERLKRHCVIDKPRGLFVDQKWVNLAPLYFDGIHNFKHQGYNMAWWNLAERKLLVDNNNYFVNSSEQPLVFFHFSGFKPGSGNYFGRTDISEYSFETRKDLIKIFDDYALVLKKNRYDQLWATKPLLVFASRKKDNKPGFTSRVRKMLKELR